ncbi:MAG: alpha-1,2-fucosyltransferase [Candidatus Synoicihabitans palmerolidicus]|nr:alpha-1,2-fucosyltransferase [Candidatus Synoicihabitans palmerolidicus]
MSESERWTNRADNIRPGSYVMGYWEAESNFRQIADQIRQEFSARQPLSDAAQAMASQIEIADQSVAIHIRRGDRTTEVEPQGLCPPQHFHHGWKALQQKYPHATPFIFSDDMEAAKFLAAQIDGAIIAEKPGEISAIEGFRIMQRCQHCVLSNRTFGWWSAWLAPHQQKTVIVPETWDLSAQTKFKKFGPSNWIVLNTPLVTPEEYQSQSTA